MTIIEGGEDDRDKFDLESREMSETFVAYNLGDTNIGDSNNANPSYQEVPDTSHKGFSSNNSMCTNNFREELKQSLANAPSIQSD